MTSGFGIGIIRGELVEVFYFSARVSGLMDWCLQPGEVDILKQRGVRQSCQDERAIEVRWVLAIEVPWGLPVSDLGQLLEMIPSKGCGGCTKL
jgi:hypothetical protein